MHVMFEEKENDFSGLSAYDDKLADVICSRSPLTIGMTKAGHSTKKKKRSDHHQIKHT